MWPLILTYYAIPYHTIPSDTIRCGFNSFRLFFFQFFLSVLCVFLFFSLSVCSALNSGTCNGLERRYSEGRRVYNAQYLKAIDNNGDGVKCWPWRYHFHCKYSICAVCRFRRIRMNKCERWFFFSLLVFGFVGGAYICYVFLYMVFYILRVLSDKIKLSVCLTENMWEITLVARL